MLILTPKKRHRKENIKSPRKYLGDMLLDNYRFDLDESFEIITWKQIGLHEKPIVFWNIDGYWDPLFAMMDRIAEEQFSGPESKNLFEIITSLDDLEAALARRPEGPHDPTTKWM